MKYDFTKVHTKFCESGMTLMELEKATRPFTTDGKGINHSTIAKALKRGTASQRTAKALANVFGLAMKRLVPTTRATA